MRACTACGEQIADLRHERTGNLAPIEVQLTMGGNVEISDDGATYRVVRAVPEIPRHRNHFASCPGAAGFRR